MLGWQNTQEGIIPKAFLEIISEYSQNQDHQKYLFLRSLISSEDIINIFVLSVIHEGWGTGIFKYSYHTIRLVVFVLCSLGSD